MRTARLVLSEGHLDQKTLAFGVFAVKRPGEILDSFVPLPLVESRLPEIEVTEWIARLQPNNSFKMPVRCVPLILLGGNHAQDHVAMQCAGFSRQRLPGQRRCPIKIALTERLVGPLQQGVDLRQKRDRQADRDQDALHVTVTWTFWTAFHS